MSDDHGTPETPDPEPVDGDPIPGQLALIDVAGDVGGGPDDAVDDDHDEDSAPPTGERAGAGGGSLDLPAWVNVRNGVIALVVFGLVLRLTQLGARPLHHDESLDAWFSWRFLNGTYDGYDPVYHGPLRFYITGAVFWMIGESETTARLLAAVSGGVVLWQIWWWRKDLGSIGTVAAVGLAAVSPSMLYFSRVGREDSFFLALTFATVLVFVSFLRRPRVWHPTALFCLLVASMAVKESVFITVFIFGGFGMLLLAQEFLVARTGATTDQADGPGHAAPPEPIDEDAFRRWTLVAGLGGMIVAFGFGEPIFVSLGIYGLALAGLMAYAILGALGRGVDWREVPIVTSLRAVPIHWWLTAVWTSILLFVMLFSQFFTEWDGPGSDAAPYGALENGLRAGFEYWRGEQDTVRGDARWQYYLAVIPAYEWFILGLSTIGIGRVLRKPTLVGQTLVWWGVASFAAHSWAGERMPWLILHPLLPFVILAGLGAQVLWDRRASSWRIPAGAVLVLGLLWTMNTAYRTSFQDDGGEPQELFVQAGQATPEVPEWTDRLYLLDRLVMAEEGRHLTVSIDSDVYWPYGWYLRDFPTGTYAVLGTESEAPNSDVIFVPHWEQSAIGDQLTDYVALPYEHRWWWVPDFDVGVGSWLQYTWDRSPWDGSESDPSDCPGSLVGQVYVRNSVWLLEQQYHGANPPETTPKPDYDGPCRRPDVAALGN